MRQPVFLYTRLKDHTSRIVKVTFFLSKLKFRTVTKSNIFYKIVAKFIQMLYCIN